MCSPKRTKEVWSVIPTDATDGQEEQDSVEPRRWSLDCVQPTVHDICFYLSVVSAVFFSFWNHKQCMWIDPLTLVSTCVKFYECCNSFRLWSQESYDICVVKYNTAHIWFLVLHGHVCACPMCLLCDGARSLVSLIKPLRRVIVPGWFCRLSGGFKNKTTFKLEAQACAWPHYVHVRG